MEVHKILKIVKYDGLGLSQLLRYVAGTLYKERKKREKPE